jgi:hypothetical protein
MPCRVPRLPTQEDALINDLNAMLGTAGRPKTPFAG